MASTRTEINWPCIFKLEGDDELIFVNSEAELCDECESLIWSDNDVLIDSTGQRYLVHHTKTKKLAFVNTEYCYELNTITHLIQASEFTKAEMCLTKIQFSSIKSAIGSLAERQKT